MSAPQPGPCPPWCRHRRRKGGHGWDHLDAGGREAMRTCEARVGKFRATTEGEEHEVLVNGFQEWLADGRHPEGRRDDVILDDGFLRPAEARRLAALLVEAADIAEGLHR